MELDKAQSTGKYLPTTEFTCCLVNQYNDLEFNYSNI